MTTVRFEEHRDRQKGLVLGVFVDDVLVGKIWRTAGMDWCYFAGSEDANAVFHNQELDVLKGQVVKRLTK